MPRTALIVGANGRFGRAMTAACHQKGWTVKLFARAKPASEFDAHEFIQGDGQDGDALMRAALGCDVLVNALNPPYSKWEKTVPVFTKNILAAANISGASVLVPGNIYIFGDTMPENLTETTPHNTTRKLGLIRKIMEESYEAAVQDGIQTIILRGGDFIERQATGNWFDSHIIPKIDKNRLMYPGPLDCIHSWAYLPDMARAFVEIAEKRRELGAFEAIGFPGYALTGAELVKQLEHVATRPLKVSGIPWPIVKLLAVFNPDLRGVVEVSYLWGTPHRIDEEKFLKLLPEFIETPIHSALRDAISEKIDVISDVTPPPLFRRI